MSTYVASTNNYVPENEEMSEETKVLIQFYFGDHGTIKLKMT